MSRFVIIHGAWHGGWAWRAVRAALEADGNSVHTPTMPGLGSQDDPHGVRLADCVDAVVDHVVGADLEDVVLVGHSWGGIVAGAALPRLVDRVRHLVMVSAFVPRVGQSLFDLVPPTHAEKFDVLSDGNGPYAIIPLLEHFGPDYMNEVSDAESRLVFSLASPQPILTFSDSLTAEMDFHAVPVAKTYVLAGEDRALPAGEYHWAPRFPDALGGDFRTVPGDHELPFTNPTALARTLDEIARRPSMTGAG